MPQAQLSRCWSHGMACAEISRMLAVRVGLPTDVAYASGMLHDIGRFGLAMALPESYKQLSLVEGYVDTLDSEVKLMGTDHTEVGRMLAEKFELPDEIRVVAGRHHDVPDGFEVDNLMVVSTACSIASAPNQLKSLEAVIAGIPQRLGDHVEPDPAYWQTNLLALIDSN
jgi:putative nucleotidyltransferase with HDIG domain